MTWVFPLCCTEMTPRSPSFPLGVMSPNPLPRALHWARLPTVCKRSTSTYLNCEGAGHVSSQRRGASAKGHPLCMRSYSCKDHGSRSQDVDHAGVDEKIPMTKARSDAHTRCSMCNLHACIPLPQSQPQATETATTKENAAVNARAGVGVGSGSV